jgi:hypothetical protein
VLVSVFLRLVLGGGGGVFLGVASVRCVAPAPRKTQQGKGRFKKNGKMAESRTGSGTQAKKQNVENFF